VHPECTKQQTSYETQFTMNFKGKKALLLIIYSLLFLENNKKGLVNSPSKDLLHRLVHLDPLSDSDVMFRESLDNEKGFIQVI